MRVLPLDTPQAVATAAAEAASVLRAGGLVVLPTDTVYGLAAAIDAAAIDRIFAAKQRPPERAVPVLLADAGAAPLVTSDFPPAARRLAARFWPGPLTIAALRRDDLPPNLTQLPTVGVRVPDHAATRAVLAAAGGALAVTSANRSDEPPACTVADALAALGERVALYLDGGPCPGGVPSTVIALEGDAPRVLRAGPITEQALRAALGLDA
ncbi:MAG: L-threonylcarbamoyladenylate synthase [Chloroflexota bacterium]